MGKKIAFFITAFAILVSTIPAEAQEPGKVYRISGFGPIEPGKFKDSEGQTIHRELISHAPGSKKKIEFFWAKPEGSGPWPAIVFVHGSQGNQVRERSGGEMYVRYGRLRRMVRRGYVAAAVSQPGYGNSDGPPDFCGPFSQEAVLKSINWLRNKTFVNAGKVGLYGYSRGAITASMVATKDNKLAAVVLGGGIYDFNKWYPTGFAGIDYNIETEAGTSKSDFAARSAIMHTTKIKAPVLLLHGKHDDRIRLELVQEFATKLRATNPVVKLKVFPDAGHGIPPRKLYREIYPFLAKHLQRGS